MPTLNITVVCSVILIGSLSGCASNPPSFGESIKAEGNAVADIGEKWEKGQALIKKGNARVSKGNKQISYGNATVTDGNTMIKTGKKLVVVAAKAYEQAYN